MKHGGGNAPGGVTLEDSLLWRDRMSRDLHWLREQVRFGKKLWKEPDLGSLGFSDA